MSAPPVRTAALAYLGAGFSVIPTHRADKKPAAAWKEFQSRLATPEEVSRWYQSWPDAGVAIVCGAISGLVVVDFDPRNGNGLAAIEHRLPLTPTARSGGGGLHFYFATSGVVVPKIPRLLPGVDLQAEASYIIVPPSVHPSRRQYRWLDGRELGSIPLAPLPPVIWEVIEIKQMPSRGREAPMLGGGRRLVLEEILDRLSGKRRAGGGWVARCPAHDDRLPSLSIGVSRDGRVLLHCFAGCDYREIVARLSEVNP